MALNETLRCFQPRPNVRTLEWSLANVQTETGKPYSHLTYPHIGAPGGPFDAIDCTQYMTIWLQWASRLGKTFLVQAAAMKVADCNPCPSMLASSTEGLAKDVRKRTYKMLDRCPALQRKIPPEHKRNEREIDYGDCLGVLAWSQSPSTLADKNIKFGHANECDKWVQPSTSTEADPLKLFCDRFKDFPIYKRIIESTPGSRSTSRIERGRLQSTNCQFWVPCPHCGEYQLLELDNIRWEKTAAGKSNKDLAKQTARYVCPLCSKDVKDEHRGPMMLAGVWCPEGATVNSKKAHAIARQWREPNQPLWDGWRSAPWIKGKPLRDGSDAGYQLTSLYALARTWGDIAEEWVDVQHNPQNLRNFINSWKAETWQDEAPEKDWQKLGKRLIDPTVSRGTVPRWGSLLTTSVDRQAETFPWEAMAWGPVPDSPLIRRGHIVAHGVAKSFDEVEQILLRSYPHADGGPPLRTEFGLMDSRHKGIGVKEFCHKITALGIPFWPCQGSTTALPTEFKWETMGPNTSMPGMLYLRVDTILTQLWMEAQLAGDATAGQLLTVYDGSLQEHEDLLRQLLNDHAIHKGKGNNSRESWDRIDQNHPNDLRDTTRYNFIALLCKTMGRPLVPRGWKPPPPAAPPDSPSRLRQIVFRR